MANNDNPIKSSRALVLGITFKENCPDIRNSRAIDVIKELEDFGVNIDVHDPEADREEVKHEYGIDLIDKPSGVYNLIVLTVGHSQFQDLSLEKLKDDKTVIYDVKAFLQPSSITARL